uniref:BPTI/Kunitz inhibitor domain-containing protein n=1 Tax=Varanus komodoensis TaxID=61221 RepID=A0A8D2L115_VARKO
SSDGAPRPAQAPTHVGVSPPTDPCVLPMDEGSCLRYTVLWYYHGEANNCRPFLFSGCGGNANRFPSRRECELCTGPNGITGRM